MSPRESKKCENKYTENYDSTALIISQSTSFKILLTFFWGFAAGEALLS